LVRLSIGLEGIDDILADLDQAISVATGEKQLIQQTENDLIKALLSSPFSREGETVRQKVIAVIGAHKISDELETIRTLGFQVIPIDERESLETQKNEPYKIDSVLMVNELTQSLFDLFH